MNGYVFLLQPRHVMVNYKRRLGHARGCLKRLTVGRRPRHSVARYNEAKDHARRGGINVDKVKLLAI